jgi:Protein of unknown function (DUF1236)
MSPARFKLIATTAMVSLLAVGSVSLGQSQNQRESPIASSKITLTMEQRHIIKEFIKSRRVDSEPSNVMLDVGNVIPKTVQLHTMPSDVSVKVTQVRNYSFFLKDSHVVLVDPKDNKVVEVIDLD